MIPGRQREYKRKDFRAGMDCGIVGCTRLARHQWAYPCAINTLIAPDGPPTFVAVCDECDIVLNRTLLQVVGVPQHVIESIMERYAMVQGDGAFT